MRRHRNGRLLSPEDLEVWQHVTKSVRPKHRRVEFSQSPTEPTPKKQRLAEPITTGLAIPPPKPTADKKSSEQLDGKLDSRLRRGRLEPERTLDLHGLTAVRAEAILKVFVEQSRREGLRLVLVITGKGRAPREPEGVMPHRKGVLRDHLPIWIASMGNAVVKSAPAHPRHGGSGAFYLYLRRHRKKC